jgi:hypothetical protein
MMMMMMDDDYDNSNHQMTANKTLFLPVAQADHTVKQ